MYVAVLDQMFVTWSTQLYANNSYIEYGLPSAPFNHMVNATMSEFVDGGAGHRVIYIYRALMKNLTMNQTYCMY